jgi:hypothetical protein
MMMNSPYILFVWRKAFLSAVIFITVAFNAVGQDKVVTGLIFDKDSKERIATISIHNITAGTSAYDNLKGEFKINAKEGDKLVFSKLGYHPDTINVQGNMSVAVYMSRLAIQLREVTVRDSVLSPEKWLLATQNDFTKIYGSLAYRDFLSMPSYGGAGLSIDALWNSLSRSGKNAERLQGIIQRDYQQNVIDYRFNRTFVARVTGLKDEKLTSFMIRYRPGYYTATTTNDYEFVSIIKNNLRRFMRSPRGYSLQPLKAKS